MRKLVFGLLTVAGALTVESSANAAERQFLIFAWDDGRPTYTQQYQAAPVQQAPQGNYYYEQQQQPNVFQQLIELENRKNAWLRRTFLGRD